MMPAQPSADMALVPESVSRSIITSWARNKNGLRPTSTMSRARSVGVVKRMGSTILMRKGSMMVCMGAMVTGPVGRRKCIPAHGTQRTSQKAVTAPITSRSGGWHPRVPEPTTSWATADQGIGAPPMTMTRWRWRRSERERCTMSQRLATVQETIREAWENGTFTRRLDAPAMPKIPHGVQLSKWECMVLGKLDCTPGGVGELVLAFPPGGSPAELVPHTHGGARIITIIEGVGLFQVERDGEWVEIELKKGVQVMFPAETLHTFIGTDGEALLAHAVHAPYLEPGHPRAIVYEDGSVEQHYEDWDPREFFPEHLGEPIGPLDIVCSTEQGAPRTATLD